jgi:GNAT superfamily N-acetyltransferase
LIQVRPTIRRGAPEDAPRLADLALKIFLDTFGPENDPADIQLHAARSYGRDIQLRELNDPSLTYFIAEVDGKPAGFAMIGEPRSPSCEGLDSPIELFRFYVDKDWHGNGRTICLSVWQKNPRAIRFYEKIGYKIAGTQPYLLGSDVQTDWLMTREVPLG